MKSIAEHYERGTLNHVIKDIILINNQYFGLFMGTDGHDLDRDSLSFVVKMINNQQITIPAYDHNINFTYCFPDGQKSFLNPLLHCLMIKEKTTQRS
ncbi:hypothetical protein [Yokenella regensburgei]|jgi:hypothetical protein|uniref:Uncharacterized protein n=1 Tax=Yokenella regensburgei TaxID=158877 RepID=A0AB38FW63_9ENTR|nr:hypothetical protein [Yokenella regensburgei]EHM51357.1 hypothetical protein HMPREF0880_00478 [Yokenella regensburgei ATCC 43003]KFD25195.1 hypothetical protein GYRE_00246 [Yokenella regensburgei ATCC 49455]QIU91604.1 hypothetical protein HEC60_20965 [Yokenella regensburgei]SQA63231.1 Uncharacterised protein [Yokenella regensburgei]SQA68651.1 Uncharacterised protein [Yokenella regensburgei]